MKTLAQGEKIPLQNGGSQVFQGYMRISLFFSRSKPMLDDSFKSTQKIQFESL